MYLGTPNQIETSCLFLNVHLHHNIGYLLCLFQVLAPHIEDMLLQSDLEQSGSFGGTGDIVEK